MNTMEIMFVWEQLDATVVLDGIVMIKAKGTAPLMSPAE